MSLAVFVNKTIAIDHSARHLAAGLTRIISSCGGSVIRLGPRDLAPSTCAATVFCRPVIVGAGALVAGPAASPDIAAPLSIDVSNASLAQSLAKNLESIYFGKDSWAPETLRVTLCGPGWLPATRAISHLGENVPVQVRGRGVRARVFSGETVFALPSRDTSGFTTPITVSLVGGDVARTRALEVLLTDFLS